MYLDGQAQATTLVENSISSGSTWGAWENPMRIAAGGRVNPTWETYTGSLDDVRVYNNVLGSGGIAQLASVPEPSVAMLTATGLIGLLAYAWRRRK